MKRLKLHMISQFGAETTDAVFWEVSRQIKNSDNFLGNLNHY